jgi:hypothetical protein
MIANRTLVVNDTLLFQKPHRVPRNRQPPAAQFAVRTRGHKQGAHPTRLAFEQLFDWNAEGRGEFVQIVDPHVALGALDGTDPCTMQPRLSSELILGPPFLRTKLPQSLREYFARLLGLRVWRQRGAELILISSLLYGGRRIGTATVIVYR